jgi:hypothetical protein
VGLPLEVSQVRSEDKIVVDLQMVTLLFHELLDIYLRHIKIYAYVKVNIVYYNFNVTVQN